jgi:hypothetical protein
MKWTPLNIDISNTGPTTGPIHTGFVASERKFSWPHFSINIIGTGKYYDYIVCNQSFKKNLKAKIFIFGFYCGFCFQDDRLELFKEFGPSFFKIR